MRLKSSLREDVFRCMQCTLQVPEERLRASLSKSSRPFDLHFLASMPCWCLLPGVCMSLKKAQLGSLAARGCKVISWGPRPRPCLHLRL